MGGRERERERKKRYVKHGIEQCDENFKSKSFIILKKRKRKNELYFLTNKCRKKRSHRFQDALFMHKKEEEEEERGKCGEKINCSPVFVAEDDVSHAAAVGVREQGHAIVPLSEGPILVEVNLGGPTCC